jgi:hypothetical protein
VAGTDPQPEHWRTVKKKNSFLARQEVNSPKRYDKKCVFCNNVIETLTKQQTAELIEALNAPYGHTNDPGRITHMTIVDVLHDWGIEAGETVVSYHRSGQRPHCMERLKEHCK